MAGPPPGMLPPHFMAQPHHPGHAHPVGRGVHFGQVRPGAAVVIAETVTMSRPRPPAQSPAHPQIEEVPEEAVGPVPPSSLASLASSSSLASSASLASVSAGVSVGGASIAAAALPNVVSFDTNRSAPTTTPIRPAETEVDDEDEEEANHFDREVVIELPPSPEPENTAKLDDEDEDAAGDENLSKSGRVYADNAKNRRLGRVGQSY